VSEDLSAQVEEALAAPTEALSEAEAANVEAARAAGDLSRRDKGDFRAVVGGRAFAKAVARALKGISSRSTQPVQNNVFLQTQEEGAVRLIATDLECIQVEVLLPATNAGNGALTLPPGTLLAVASSIGDEELELRGEVLPTPAGGRLYGTCGATGGITAARTRVNLRGLDAKDFECLPTLGGEVLRFELPQGLLRRVIAQVRPAVSGEATRPTLNGVNVIAGNHELTFVATDTHRLALRKVAGLEVGGNGQSSILPARVLAELEAVLDPTSEAPVQVALSETAAEFSGLGANGELTLSSRLIEGQFPDYQKVIPTKCERSFSVDREQFVEALRRVLIIAREDCYRARFTLSGDVLVIAAESADVGDMTVEVEAEARGEAWEGTVAFSVRYLLDGLGGLNAARVGMELSGPLNPGMVVSGDFRYVLMPMQV
jgi:DNA polymerase-3 subunit beta